MKKILNKILEEINKSEPRLDYIRGLIEASVEEEQLFVTTSDSKMPIMRVTSPEGIVSTALIDEAAILDAKAKAHIAKFGNNLQVE